MIGLLELTTYVFVLDVVLVDVGGSRAAPAHIFLNGQGSKENFVCVFATRLGEGPVGNRSLMRERQLAEGGVCLLRIEFVRQLSQFYTANT